MMVRRAELRDEGAMKIRTADGKLMKIWRTPFSPSDDNLTSLIILNNKNYGLIIIFVTP